MKRTGKWVVNILIATLSITTCLLLVQRLQASLERPIEDHVVSKSDDALSLPGVRWNTHQETLVFALQTGCHFCFESVPFHRQLVDLIHGSEKNAGLGAVALFPGDRRQAIALLAGEKISFRDEEVKEFDFHSLSVPGTPTLLLVDRTGHVVKRWAGKLSNNGEEDVLRTLAAARDMSIEEGRANTELGEEIFHIDFTPPTEVLALTQASYPAILDVRTRGAFAEGHLRNAINIPMDELATRASHELPADRPIAIYCEYHNSCEENYQRTGVFTPCSSGYLTLRSMGFLKATLIDGDSDAMMRVGASFVRSEAR